MPKNWQLPSSPTTSGRRVLAGGLGRARHAPPPRPRRLHAGILPLRPRRRLGSWPFFRRGARSECLARLRSELIKTTK